jgi:hypothetical protein
MWKFSFPILVDIIVVILVGIDIIIYGCFFKIPHCMVHFRRPELFLAAFPKAAENLARA